MNLSTFSPMSPRTSLRIRLISGLVLLAFCGGATAAHAQDGDYGPSAIKRDGDRMELEAEAAKRRLEAQRAEQERVEALARFHAVSQPPYNANRPSYASPSSRETVHRYRQERPASPADNSAIWGFLIGIVALGAWLGSKKENA